MSGKIKKYSREFYKRKNKKKRIAIAATVVLCSALLVFGIVMLAITAVLMLGNDLGNVSDLKATAIKSKSVTLEWTGTESAEGYFVYKKAFGDEKFSKSGTLRGSEKNKFTVKNLKQKQKYEFYVTAFKRVPQTVESKGYDVISLCTRPKKITVTRAESPKKGILKIEWQKASGALGYEVQYTDGARFSKTDFVKVTASENSVEFQELEPGSVYKVRVRSYIMYNKKELPGEWSNESTVKIAEKFRIPDYIDPDKPMVALTFDDGPCNNNASDRILDTLEKYGAKATFFMVGKNTTEHPDNVLRKYELGMELGNHTWDHTRYSKKVKKKDIRNTSEAIFDICGAYPTAFRSPGGMTTEKMLEECNAEGMTAYYWSIDTEDWNTRNAKTTAKRVLKNAEDGDIILMHEIYASTADAVEKIVPKLIKKGFQLVTCRDLISAKTGSYPKAGKQYHKAP